MKKSKLIVLVLSVLVAGTIFFTNENLFKADEKEEVVIVEGVYIGGVDVSGMTAQEATDAVNAYVDELKAETVILKGPNAEFEMTYGDMGLTSKVNTAVAEAVTVAQYGNLIQRYMNMKDLEKEALVIDMGLSIDKQVVAEAIYAKKDKLNIEASDNGVIRKNNKYEFIPGKTGNEVEIEKSVNALSDKIANEYELAMPKEDTFELISVVKQPRGSEEEFNKMTDMLGTFSTFYGDPGSGRSQNVENGCAKLNGILLFPGDEVSVHDVTAPYTVANGYAVGYAYENGNVIESVGGGICQVATTIYNALLQAEVEIVARYNHSMTVGYVPLSGDAAIAGTYKDLKFKNNFETPIYIEGLCKDGWIGFAVYGQETRPDNREISFESETISEKDPETEYTLSDKEPVGTYKIDREKHIGYSAKYWKIVKVDGVETERIQVNKSYYIDSCMKVTIGTKGATAEQLKKINEVLLTKDDVKIKEEIEGLLKPATPETPSGTQTPTTPGTGSNTQTPGNQDTTPGNDANTGNGGTQTPVEGTDETPQNPVENPN